LIQWPDKIYYSNHPCVSLDFSRSNPGLLAAGFTNGKIVIYDVRLPGEKIAADKLFLLDTVS
jgi:hypothetical protein